MNQQQYVYEIQVGGIRCINCANKIKSSVPPKVSTLKQISVNVLAEKVQVVLTDDQSINNVVETIKELHFTVAEAPKQILLNNKSDERIITLSKSIQTNDFQSVNEFKRQIDEVKTLPGISSIQFSLKPLKCLASITYNPNIIKGRTVFEECKSRVSHFQVENPHLDNFKSRNISHNLISSSDLFKAFFVIIFYVVYSMIIPEIAMFHEIILYPKNLNIFTFYTIFILLFTFITINKFGRKIYVNAYFSFKQFRALNMDTLITLGSLSALIMAIFLLFLYFFQSLSDKSMLQMKNGDDLNMIRLHNIMTVCSMLETSSLILAIITIGKYLESKAKQSILLMTEQMFPQDEFLKYTQLSVVEPKNKELAIESQKIYDISLVEQNDLIMIEGQMRLLLDGTILKIIEPVKIVDSVCYGQDDPFDGKVGDKLKSGASIKYGKAIIQVNNTIENSMLTQISKQLNLAQNACESTESGLSVIFQKLSQNFVKVVIMISSLTLIAWCYILYFDKVEVKQYCRWCFPFEKSISILVISCPCALGLAIPSVLSITLNLAMKHGVLIKKNIVFDRINKLKAVLFDKTGTLFTRIEQITEYQLSPGIQFSEIDLWGIIQLLEGEQKHPIAQLLYQQAIKKTQGNILNSTLILSKNPETLPNGLKGQIINKMQNDTMIQVLIGNKQLLAQNEIQMDNSIKELIETKEKLGRTAIVLCIDKAVCMAIFINNTNNLRAEAKDVVQYLQHKLKQEVYILSGDAQNTVADVGNYLGIPKQNLKGEIDAQSKLQLLKQLRKQEGKPTMMIGDNLNDILSIYEADVGVSINAKSELNLLASDIVILSENLWLIPFLFNLMRKSRTFIILNLVWAFAYNVTMAPVAAGVFYKYNISIQPMFASAAMAASSIIVVMFSNLMRFLEYDPSKTAKVREIAEKSQKQIQVQNNDSNSSKNYEKYMELNKINNQVEHAELLEDVEQQ